MKYPAGFSLLEIMLVIVIVGVVVVASQSLFVGTQQSKYA
jgi:prepilin-type N-terminal cleavage/methylation domain-containing protein